MLKRIFPSKFHHLVGIVAGVRPSDRYGGAWLRGSARVAVVMFGGLAAVLLIAFLVGR
jgi:hypothetical protein